MTYWILAAFFSFFLLFKYLANFKWKCVLKGTELSIYFFFFCVCYFFCLLPFFFFCERSIGGGIDKLETSCAVCFSNLVQCSRCLLLGFFLRERKKKKKKENGREEKAHEYTGSGDHRACVKLSFFSFVFAFL